MTARNLSGGEVSFCFDSPIPHANWQHRVLARYSPKANAAVTSAAIGKSNGSQRHYRVREQSEKTADISLVPQQRY